MNPINSLIVEGNLTRDPEFKETSGGYKVCNLSIAVNRSYKNSEGKKVDEVSYFDIEAFGTLAQNCARYCEKGRGIRVVGRIKQNRWTNQDGKPTGKVLIVAEHIEFKPKFNQSKTDAEAENKATETVPTASAVQGTPATEQTAVVAETAAQEVAEKVPEEVLTF